jgi:hypothetical protein
MIEYFVQKLCETGAKAVVRYFNVSGVWPPELFVTAFILDHLGDEFTMTMETGFTKLVDWNSDVRKRRGLSGPPLTDHLVAPTADLGAPCIDLIAFEGRDRPKNEQDMLALIEFKGGWIDGRQTPGSDRNKILRVLQLIETCPYGVIAGWASSPANRDWAYRGALETGDKWFETKFELKGRPLSFCARLFGPSARDQP